MPRGIPNQPRAITAGADGAVAAVAPTRAETVRQERRRKPGSIANPGIKLSVDESRLDRNTYHYRHVNDVGNRVAQLEAQDYDIVRDGEVKPDGAGLGSVPTTHGGIDDSGKPYGMVLMRKRKDWFEADQKEKQKPLDEMEQAIRRGNPTHKGNDLKGSGVYTPGADEFNPGGVNILERAQ
jgi:hypothetical protein